MSQEVESDNIYALSDEQILQQDLSQVGTENEQTSSEEQGQETSVPDVNTNGESSEIQEQAQEQETTSEVKIVESQPTEKSSEEEQQTDSEVDYKAFYETVTKPFVANGKELHVNKPEDMIRLMQQGAGYHKKMADLKPLKRINKLLEDNQLLDESQLGYLIDLHKKKPEAIAKLVKDSGIDLYEFNTDVADTYVPQAPQVSMGNDALNEVLEDLQTNSPTYSQTISVIGNDWDDKSRSVLSEHPELIRAIDSHMQSGVFQQIQQTIEYERTLGRLTGVSDLQAYKLIGDQLFGNAENQQPQQQIQQPVVLQQVSQTQTNIQNTQRKKAAVAPKTTTTEVKPQTNVNSMSDEEVLKATMTQY